MLGKPDRGTRVDSVMLGAASNSMPPARTCDSISGSPPSWLLGNTVTFSRPDDCAPMARAASVNRTVRGWVSGVLTPSLNSNSAAALAGLPRMVVAQPAEADASKALRAIFIVLVSLKASFLRTTGLRKVRRLPSDRRRATSTDETILRNPRNHPETYGGYTFAQQSGRKDRLEADMNHSIHLLDRSTYLK